MTRSLANSTLAVVLGLCLPLLGDAPDTVARTAPESAAGSAPQRTAETAAAGESVLARTRSRYIIGLEDVLQVSVYQEPELSLAQVPVRPDGRISLPLIGDVQADGKTSEDLADEIEELYQAHVVAPEVTVIVMQVNSFKIFIVGSVQRPGVFQLGRATTILQALALAGGFTDFANSKKMALFREEDDGTHRIPLNYQMIVSGENMALNIKLKPGDTLLVP